MPYPTFKQTLLGGSNGFKPTAQLSAFPAGVSAFDRTFTREYNNQRGAALNQQQTQRAFNSGYRKLMRGARGGDPRALDSLMRMAPNYQRIGDIGTAQYGPNAQDQLNSDEWYRQQGSQALAQNPTAQNQNFTNLWNRPSGQGVPSTPSTPTIPATPSMPTTNNGIRDTLMQPSADVAYGQQAPELPSRIPNRAAGQVDASLSSLMLMGAGAAPAMSEAPFDDFGYGGTGGTNAPPAPLTGDAVPWASPTPPAAAANQPAVSAMRQPQTPYENAMAAVSLRRQQQIEQGVGGMQPLANPNAAQDALLKRLPPTQNSLVPLDQAPTTAQVVPGIGNTVGYDNGTRAVMGKYGTGVATIGGQKPDKERTIEEIDPATGKKIKMTTTEWFRKSAERQGVANKFAENEAQIRRIMEMKGTKYQPPPPVR